MQMLAILASNYHLLAMDPLHSFGVKETKEKMQISNLNPTVQKKEELGKCGQTEKEKEMVI